MKNPNWRRCVICGDSKDIIKRIPDNSIDFILTDPPYNIGKHSTGNIPLPGRTAMNNNVADWDWIDFNPEEWADEFIRILKPTGNLFIFTTYNQIGRWYNCLDHRFDTSNFMVWHKTNPAPKIFKAGFFNSCEMIFTCWNKKHTWNFSQQNEMHNFIQSPICMRPERLIDPKHPAQKPISILRRMIEIASNEDDIIFDPFMGVGSTGVAALMGKRRFIGVEISPTYFEAAKKRVNNELIKQQSEINFEMKSTFSEPPVPYQSASTICDYGKIEDVFDGGSKKSSTGKISRLQTSLQPILKWAGGKDKELKYIIPNAPVSFNNYYEPFVGGGAVYTAFTANHFYINDFSNELISLYRNIADQNENFFSTVDEINRSWGNAHQFFLNSHILIDEYVKFRNNEITQPELKVYISKFCAHNQKDILNILGDSFPDLRNVFQKEISVNLYRKMCRMKLLEQQKHILPENDLKDNVETAIKSALYMYYRNLYNKVSIEHNPTLHCALFLYIRNYAYSGMFRYNRNGEFNVPYGGIAYNSKTMTKKLLYYRDKALLNHFANTTIYNLDFEEFLNKTNPQEDDFVFLDPPYDSEFSTYAQNEFTKADQERLAGYMMNKCKAKWMMIIKNTDFIYNLYHKEGIHIQAFDKEYIVSFMNRNDKKVNHLLITNYE